MDLTKKQQKLISDNHDRLSLTELTRLCFDNKNLTGRHREGRLVRKYLIDNAMGFETSRYKRVEGQELTDRQKELSVGYADDGLSSYRIAQIVFPDREVKKLGLEQRAVFEYLKEINPDFATGEMAASGYSPPKAVSRLVRKVNSAAGEDLHEGRLTKKHETCLKKLKKNLSNSRFMAMMNSFVSKDDSSLFEDEFIRLTWDKPDLTADEINLYMNVCKDIVNLEIISQQLYKLNELFSLTEESYDQNLMNAIRVKTTEYNSCESRIEDLTKKLQGDRSERMKNKRAENASILSIVELFQDEQERQNISKIAELQKRAVEKEVARLESFDEWKARVLGISQDDVL
jgi:hypothetical protein